MIYSDHHREFHGADSATRNRPAFTAERLLREADRYDGEVAGVSEQQLQQAVGEYLAGRNASRIFRSDIDLREIAQEMAFQAMESDRSGTALDLADSALALDPECVDALAVRATLSAVSDSELIRQLKHAVAVGEARLGEEFFAENMGDFWSLVAARPYLRTVRRLAAELWDAGRRFEAVANFDYLLELDPGDHQDCARTLLACYLGMGEVGRTLALLADYGRDDAISQSGAALAHYLAGDHVAADAALTRVRRLNPHVLPYLAGDLEVPDEPRCDFQPGSEDEAIACGQILGDVWSNQSAARLWILACDDPIGGDDTVAEPAAAACVAPNHQRA